MPLVRIDLPESVAPEHRIAIADLLIDREVVKENRSFGNGKAQYA